MTTFLLIRHAIHDLPRPAIACRTPGARLGAAGKAQAEQLAERLSHMRVAAVYSSPLERCQETALPIATRLGIRAQTAEALNELDYGDWTGRSLEELDALPHWKTYNGFRSGTRIPNGELLLDLQTRAVHEILRLRQKHDGLTVALVTHAEVIRCVVAHFLGAPLDLALRIEISPASITVLELEPWGPRLLRLNDTGGPFSADSL